MDDIFNSNRLKLIDQFAALQKEEAVMEPLVSADPPDEPKLLAQIDRVAQARAELEKANARMLLGLRRQLTHEQFLKLKAERPPMHGPIHGHGPDDGRHPTDRRKHLRFQIGLQILNPQPRVKNLQSEINNLKSLSSGP
jgi:hypothetical protein